MTNKNKIIILIGPQGSGKGTFAEMIARQRDIKVVASGAAFRAAALSPENVESLKCGALMPDELVYEIMSRSLPRGCDILLDGFPRTIGQAKWLEQWAGNNYEIQIVFLDIPDSITLTRIAKRIRDGGGRADDADMGSIKTRLALYHEKTEPLIEYLRSNDKVKFSRVDASRTLEENFKDVEAAIK
jgi:adenylate kinase